MSTFNSNDLEVGGVWNHEPGAEAIRQPREVLGYLSGGVIMRRPRHLDRSRRTLPFRSLSTMPDYGENNNDCVSTVVSQNVMEDEDDIGQIKMRLRKILGLLRGQRVNIIEVLDLEEVLKCVYAPLGCRVSITSKGNFNAHTESCEYRKFSRCLIAGCEAGAATAFGSFNEFASHHADKHADEIKTFTTAGINSQILIPGSVFECRRVDFIKVIGVTTLKSNYAAQKVITFLRILALDGFDCPRLIPVSICFGENCGYNNDDGGGTLHHTQVAHCIEAEYNVSSIEQLKFASDFAVGNKPFAYRGLNEYLEDKDRHNRHYIRLEDATVVGNISSFQEGDEKIFSLTVSVKFSATRILLENVIDKGKKTTMMIWLCSWADLFKTNAEKMMQCMIRLILKGYACPYGYLRTIPMLSSQKKFLLLEARDKVEILIGLMMKEIGGIYKELYEFGPGFQRTDAWRVSEKQVRKIPDLEDSDLDIKYKPVPFSPVIIIVADSVQTCRLLKSQLDLWFPELVVVVGHDMRIPEVRQQVIMRCDIFIATIARLNIHMKPKGYHVVGSGTELVLVYHCDRIMSGKGEMDVRVFLFPTLDDEFQVARKVLWTPRILKCHERLIREEFWKDNEFGIISAGPVGAMGLEKINYSKEIVNLDFQKKDVLRNFISENQNQYNHMVIVCKSDTALWPTEILVKKTVPKNVKVCRFTKDARDDPGSEIQLFLRRNPKAIMIMTPMLLNTTEIPLVDAVILYGIPPNFGEFYRATEIANEKIFVIGVLTYGDDRNSELLKFENELGSLIKNLY